MYKKQEWTKNQGKMYDRLEGSLASEISEVDCKPAVINMLKYLNGNIENSCWELETVK